MEVVRVKQIEVIEARELLTQTISFSTQITDADHAHHYYVIFLDISYRSDGTVKYANIRTNRTKPEFKFSNYWGDDTLKTWKIVNGLIERAIDYIKELNGSEVQIMKSEYNTTIHI